MSEFEQSFKGVIFDVVDEALQKYVDRLSNQEVYMTIAQLSEKLSVSTDKVHSWINRKKNPLPAYNDGERGTRIFESEFKIWYKKQYRINPGQVKKLINIKSA